MDVMVLTAATASGLGIARVWWTAIRRSRIGPNYEGMDATIRAGLWLVLAWTVAIVPLRLRRPRPSLRRVGRQPGTITSIVVLATFCFMLVKLRYVLDVRPWPLALRIYLPAVTTPSSFVIALLSCFLTLAPDGRWSPPADWVDRLGRLLALAWIAAYAALVALSRSA